MESTIAVEQATPGIGQLRESSLHAALKAWYARPGDRLEAVVDGCVVDVVRDDLLIEVQVSNLLAIRDKLRRLAGQSVLLVHPVASEKVIVHVDAATGEIVRRRRSPKRGRVEELFDELVHLGDDLNRDGLTLDVPLVAVEELRCADGRGSWRRQGVSIVDRRLIEVRAVEHFASGLDLARLLPAGLVAPFSNRDLAAALGLRRRLAQRMTYCLRQVGVLREAGKRGHALLFERTI
ncbi:MAG: hypothetical protein V1772_07050 [Chloroflexota bacterium]